MPAFINTCIYGHYTLSYLYLHTFAVILEIHSHVPHLSLCVYFSAVFFFFYLLYSTAVQLSCESVFKIFAISLPSQVCPFVQFHPYTRASVHTAAQFAMYKWYLYQSVANISVVFRGCSQVDEWRCCAHAPTTQSYGQGDRRIHAVTQQMRYRTLRCTVASVQFANRHGKVYTHSSLCNRYCCDLILNRFWV